VEEHGDSNKDEIDRKQEHSKVFGDIHASFLKQTRRLCTLKDIPHDQMLVVNCQFGRRGRIGWQAASLPRMPIRQAGSLLAESAKLADTQLRSFSQTDNQRTLLQGHRPEARF
jgi:hypothetical protein